MLSDSEITEIIRELYLGWTSALTVRDYSWFEKHLARDFMLSAQPFPEMRVNKEEFIEIDKKIGRADIRFVTVKAERAGDIVVSFAVADITEEFDQDLGTGLPTAGELNKLLDGK